MFRQLAGSDTWYERYRSMEACAVGKVVPCVEWSVYMEAVDAVHVMLRACSREDDEEAD